MAPRVVLGALALVVVFGGIALRGLIATEETPQPAVEMSTESTSSSSVEPRDARVTPVTEVDPEPESRAVTQRSAEPSTVRGAPLVGRVVDELDRPVVADVTAGPRGSSATTADTQIVQAFDPGLSRTVRTELDGTFRIEGLSVGRVDVVAVAEGRVPAGAVNVAIAAQSNRELILRAATGRTLEGRVERSDGAPIANALIVLDVLDWRADDAVMRDALTRSARTDERGAFRFDGLLPERPLRARAFARGLLHGEAQRVAPDQLSITIRLEPAPFVLLRVLDRASGRPILGTVVQFAEDVAARDTSVLSSLEEGRPSLLRGEAASQRIGRALPADAAVAVDLQRRAVRVRVAAAGYATALVSVTALTPGEVREHVVELELEARLSGLVVRHDQTPIAGAVVFAHRLGEADLLDETDALAAGDVGSVDPLAGRGPSLRPPSIEVATDASGRFELRGLGDGAHRITLHVEEHTDLVEPLDVVLAAGVNELPVIVLPARATLTCTVVDGEGRPAPGVEIAITPFVEGGADARSLERLTDPLALATTDAAGRVRIAWLAPGRVVARARHDLEAAGDEDARVEVALRSGREESITLRIPSR